MILVVLLFTFNPMDQPIPAVSALSYTDDDSDTCRIYNNNNNNNNDWLDLYMLDADTSQDIELVLLLLSSIRRLLNSTVHAWIVPLYTLGVFGYLVTLYVKRFCKRRKSRHHRNQQTKCSASTLVRPAVVVESATTIQEPQPQKYDQGQPINLSGVYKLIQIENLDAFLAAQGVPWPFRKAAAKVMPLHDISHTHHQITIRIDAGPIQTSTTYRIGCGSVETEVRGRLFRDNVNYLKDDVTGKVVGVVNEKTAVAEGYQVTVSRRLSDDKKYIHMESIASFPNDPTKENIVSTQLFERVER